MLANCGAINANGGLYYSIGPFTAPGTLNLTTSGTNSCTLGGDTLVALYDNAVPTAPTYISYSTNYSGGACSSYSFQVTQAHVNAKGGKKLLVGVGMYNNDAANAGFNQTITFSASYICAK
jgi:hypothetical protein